ncbi:1-deoxy-D-xylulose-5-phosphate synthase [Pseudoalteromonas aurantia]|uniref:1-deoxy-D-xylulose-5-phosphate synthase n=1 Tax=Pseudoalteromonas aurantia TaxID=43654 RepID=A0A5S3VDM8_9GAMM|nr:1-deoxy-D-xylulose-5-phosphate synthase [Pseudoalteromonas aurantia]TMO64482.1 1-deoxy-D-xylulose-5-phosphate synthase [Pseudoalteromonas aurantia]TMO70414.1 1-deoxy-D-xylulose-5-phosphate synthase [Pseudoalteromonas aurantia]TMO77719.1 1-deoxy-D-xylulose-5-phosphate synthase [Pseudoalteromonas aurantia]
MTFDSSKYPLLALVEEPEQLRQLPQHKLPSFSKELREYLLNSVSQSSGHFASGLGTVELTVALHYVYNTPEDRLIWDVGHQAYPHKILTGRREKIHTIRQKDGLHPFPYREESPYDTFSVGHSSTSISAALGMSIAAKQEGKGRKTVAVIGDGAITAGMAFEAMNHAGDIKSDMLIILNDNEMSISENVGALTNHFAKILSGSFYTNIREGSKKLLSGVPPVKELASKVEEHLKGMVIPGTFFEELGLNYIGPIDGHNVNMLVDTLRNMRNLKGPQILHIKTQKGKGYEPAEADPIGYHAVPRFDPSIHSLPKSKPAAPTFSKVFGQWLCDMAAQDPRLMAITPAMREGSGMVQFSKQFPEQYFDVAIAEQHAVTLAAGLACENLKPVVAIYSSFLQRAYDQLIHDVALQNLPVLFAIDRAGIVGADGETHQGAYDLSFMRCIPNMIIMTPSDTNECRQMLYTGFNCDQPVAVRYPRGSAGNADIEQKMTKVEIGKANTIRVGEKIAILSFGTLLHNAQFAADEFNTSLVDMRFVKPIDTQLLSELSQSHTHFITLEDNAIAGGAGSAVSEFLASIGAATQVSHLGIPDEFIKHGTQDEMHHEMGLSARGICDYIRNLITN